MGNPRSYFRPDHQPERNEWYRHIANSPGRKAIKHEHARRQRQFNSTVINNDLVEWEDGQWE